MRRLALVAGAVILLFLVAPHAEATSSATKNGAVRKVLLVSYPATTWERVQETAPPVLLDLVRRSAVASTSVRAIGPTTSPGEAYTTIGAGNRAGAEDATAGLALPPPAAFEGDAAVQVFERRCGCRSNDAAVVHVGMPRAVHVNERYLYGTEPGALGEALADAGRSTGVIANADEAFGTVGEAVHREAALGVVDEEGRVSHGSVGPQLVVKDPAAPFGVRTDVDAAADAAAVAWDAVDVLLVEMSDLARAERYSDVASPGASDDARAAAMASSDELLGRLLRLVDPERDVVLVVGATAPSGPMELTIAAISGPGIEPGKARSATTRRAGFVTLPDVAPTVLDAFDLDLPDAMNGTAITSSGGGPPDLDTVGALASDNEVARFRDRATGPVSVTFIVFQVVGYGLAALALTRWPRARPWVAFMALVTLAQPALAFLSRLVPYEDLTVPGYVAVFFVAGAALAALAFVAGRALAGRAGAAAPLVPPLLLVSLTLLVLVVDVLAGAPLQLNTVFGYSPTVAGRFAGFGNLAFALVAASSLIVATGLWGVAVLRGSAVRRATLLAAAVLLVVVVVDGLPSLGSDVGGILALVPAAAVVVVLLAGARLDPLRGGLIVFGTAAALVAFALVDLSRPEDARTHLGRLAARVVDDGGGGLGTVIERKVNANVAILTSSVWTWVIPFAIAFFAFLVWRRTGLLRRLEERTPGLRACLIGALVAGALGFALNDSGVAVPAMMLAVVLPYVSYLVVVTEP